jgi:hypothetical protein
VKTFNFILAAVRIWSVSRSQDVYEHSTWQNDELSMNCWRNATTEMKQNDVDLGIFLWRNVPERRSGNSFWEGRKPGKVFQKLFSFFWVSI